jgi:protein-S-isoprenylcysteine O-methyltransferase Ste14
MYFSVKLAAMDTSKDNPGIYIPPPLVYVAIFLLSLLIQKYFPIDKSFFHTSASSIIGTLFIIIALFFNLPAIRLFIKTKNSIIPIKPATSLQTSGIYAVSRNPMYLSLLLIYSGFAFLIANWWTLILLPLLVAIITGYVIKSEERYLERAFGKTYLEYKEKVRRWF